MLNKINVTRVCHILGISRPTMYKYMLFYDDESKKKYIPKKILKLFDYINSCENVNESTYSYIYTRFKK